MATLAAQHVTMSFGEAPNVIRTLTNVTTTFRSGELTLVRGPSGSGKSTLLAILGGLLTPDEGTVSLDDVCLTLLPETERAAFRLTRLGFVFQTFQLFETLTALENVALPMVMSGEREPHASARARGLLEMMGLAARSGLRPRQMSGGEQQRVAIARALSGDPAAVLADEPTAALDGVAGRVVATLLRRTAVEFDKVVAVISHDERLLPFADRVVTLSDGRIVSDERTPCVA